MAAAPSLGPGPGLGPSAGAATAKAGGGIGAAEVTAPQGALALSGTAVAPLPPSSAATPPVAPAASATSGATAAGGRSSKPPNKPVQGSPAVFSSTPSLFDQPLPQAPERYGKYNLLEKIGAGGMAEVWRAKTLGAEGFTKDLVIKRILPKFTNDEESVRMFIDEARLVAKLHHPNIVQIFDFDKEGDRYYLAMELVEGRDLRLAEKASAKGGVWFPIHVSIYLITEALKGLHYAHTRMDHGKPLEIVHRDVSPHNILISFSGDVKISDFGIAKVAERASSSSSGTVKGKLAYMSPEQITGQPLDGRTDIYSMGIVFWELLTRHRLFFGPDEQDVIRRVRDGVVPPPRQYNPEIPEEVEQIVLKMLVANRAQRYQSAGEVVRALTSLPQYSYEAQSLGEFMRTLFPEKTRNWTKVLQSMLRSPTGPNAKVEDAPQLAAAAKSGPPSAPSATSGGGAGSGPSGPSATKKSAPGLKQPTLTLKGAAAAAAASALASAAPPPGPPPAPAAAPPAAPAAAAPMPPGPASSPPDVPRSSPTEQVNIDDIEEVPAEAAAPAAARPQFAAAPSGVAAKDAAPPTLASLAQAPMAPAARSNMSGSEQKTQIATEVPPQVAAALGSGGVGGSAGAPPGAPPAAVGAGARTMIAEAPALPPGPPPMAAVPPGAPPAAAGAGARTMIAEAPGLPPSAPMNGPMGGGPPLGPPRTAAPQQATMFSGPSPNLSPPGAPAGQTLPPGSVRQLPLRPAGMVFNVAAMPTGGLPPNARWAIGPAIALVMAFVTAFVAGRIWLPANGSSSSSSIFTPSRKVRIVTEPKGAFVQVDGETMEGKTPLEVKGDVGTTRKLRIMLDGYEAREVSLLFRKEEQPPLRIPLTKVGAGPQKKQDPTAFDAKEGIKDPEDQPTGDQTGKTTDKTADKTTDKTDKTDKTADKTDKTGKDGEPDDKGDKKDRTKRDKDKKDDKNAKKAGRPTLSILVRPFAIVFVDNKKIGQTPIRDFALSPGSHTIILENAAKGKREKIGIKATAGQNLPSIVRDWQ